MSSQFEEAPLEARNIATKLIAQYHSHLVEAKILYLFRWGSWKVNGKTRWGSASKCSGKEKFMSGCDFVITINAEIWDELELKQKEALIDHELMHCERSHDYDEEGNPIWCIREHDFVGFAQEVKRHGFWTKDLQRFDKVYRQITIFDVNRTA